MRKNSITYQIHYLSTMQNHLSYIMHMNPRTFAALAALSKAVESKEYDSDRYPVSWELPVSIGAAGDRPSSLAVARCT